MQEKVVLDWFLGIGDNEYSPNIINKIRNLPTDILADMSAHIQSKQCDETLEAPKKRRKSGPIMREKLDKWKLSTEKIDPSQFVEYEEHPYHDLSIDDLTQIFILDLADFKKCENIYNLFRLRNHLRFNSY